MEQIVAVVIAAALVAAPLLAQLKLTRKALTVAEVGLEAAKVRIQSAESALEVSQNIVSHIDRATRERVDELKELLAAAEKRASDVQAKLHAYAGIDGEAVVTGRAAWTNEHVAEEEARRAAAEAIDAELAARESL